MESAYHLLLTDLRGVINALGREGGQIGPSIYDTAQVLRLAPPSPDHRPIVEWLLDQQQPDGGWGDPAAPLARDVPTLAAILALKSVDTRRSHGQAITAGAGFLRRQAHQWEGPLPEDIPLAAELILPGLVEQASQHGLDVDSAAYDSLRELGRHRRRLLARFDPQPGTPLVHSFEAWGEYPDPTLFDSAGSIGHSPAATAAWIAIATGRDDLAGATAAARRYLVRASAATRVGVPGVVGAVWPYARNEQIVSLFTLLLAGLLDHPMLIDLIQPHVDNLWSSLRPEGHGISDHFATDGDLTAMSFAVLAASGYQPPLAVLQGYLRGRVCMTYPHEMQRSLSATTHAAYTLAMLGGDPAPLLDSLDSVRNSAGYWDGDKWHTSWLYLSSHTMFTLLAAGRHDDARAVLPTLIDHQRADGGWGATTATMEETAYGMLALLGLARVSPLPPEGLGAVHRAGKFMLANYRPLAVDHGTSWIAKGLYRPTRIARVEEIAALLGYVALIRLEEQTI